MKVKKMWKNVCYSAVAFLLIGGICLGVAAEKSDVNKVRINSNKAPVNSILPSDTSVTQKENSNNEIYDLSVTSWNVGGCARGIDSGITKDTTKYNWQQGLDEWETFFAKGENAMPSDVYCLQEFYKYFYKEYNGDTVNEATAILAKDKFAPLFNELEAREGKTHDIAGGPWTMSSAIGTTKKGGFHLYDVSYGYLSGKSPRDQRMYIKGYIDVNGKKVAIYSVHLGFEDRLTNFDSYNELIELMRKEEYCIVMGDMNSSALTELFEKAGANVANCGKFGEFQTYMYRNNAYLDNIFTTPNIDIKYVECLSSDNNPDNDNHGFSDHYPITAYLTVNADKANTMSAPQLDKDGFVAEYY